MFASSIAPLSSVTKSVELEAKADAAPASYPINFSYNYDAVVSKDPVTDTESLSIQVIQIPKINFSKIQISPTELYVGQDGNIMTSVYNIGKSNVYNVTVKFSDEGGLLSEGESYLGNIQPGATGAVDIYVPVLAEGAGKLVMTVTYEDEDGKSYTDSQSTDIVTMIKP